MSIFTYVQFATIMEKIFHLIHILLLLILLILNCLVEEKADTYLIGSLWKVYYIKKYTKLTSTDRIRIDFQCQYFIMSICNNNGKNISCVTATAVDT